ncbi:hypothetical protein F4803DRAFT_529632 [Xylaria telfairii]|nr:hypothetical protein F4803DRAFT_529632 [Xylaria telfairii]
MTRSLDMVGERRVANVIKLIEEVSRGVHDDNPREVIERMLFPGDYEILQDVIQGASHEHLIQQYDATALRSYIEDHLKDEYIPSTRGRRQFRVLMGSALHNKLERYWDKITYAWLGTIEHDSTNRYSRKTKNLVQSIEPFGSAMIRLPNKTKYRAGCGFKVRHDSTDNATHIARKGNWPSLVVEVVWTRPLEQQKIKDYIHETNGAIRTIVEIDLRGTHRKWNQIKRNWKVGGNNRGPVVISIWRAQTDDDGELQVVQSPALQICGEDGTFDASPKACVSLGDFLAERDQGDFKMSPTELRNLESVVFELDIEKFVSTIDGALEDQKIEDDGRDEDTGNVTSPHETRRLRSVTSFVEIAGHRLRRLPGRRDG